MSQEIKVDAVVANRGLADMRSAASVMPTKIAKEIKGENDLDAVREYNEIKQEYEAILTQFEKVFHKHLLAAGEAVEKYRDTDQHVANAIRMKS
jgi:hypothetical protein